MAKPPIYLASPLGFADSTRPFMTSLVQHLSPHVHVMNPWDDHRFDADFARLARENNFIARQEALHAINIELARSNVQNIERAQAVFAVLDGVDVDSGTAAEIGYAFARRKLVYGLRTDFRLAADNHGSTVNLQVEYFIEASGGKIIQTVDELIVCALAIAVRNGG